MDNAELIAALRYCGGEEKYCKLCPSYDTCHAEVDGLKQILLAAADVLEELQQIADHHEQTTKDFWNEACEYKQRIAELEAQLPKEGECEAKKPKTVKETEYSFYCDCPTCGGRLISNVDGEWCAGSFDRFCRICGQKIDWSEYCGRSNMPRGARMKGEQG